MTSLFHPDYTIQEVAEKVSFYLCFIQWPNCFTKVCEEMKDVEL